MPSRSGSQGRGRAGLVSAKPSPVVWANFLRCGPRGRPGDLRKAGRAVAYYTWREGEDQPREQPRRWYSADGRVLDYATARREIVAQAREAPYTYRVVLSSGGAPLTPTGYGAVLDEQFRGRWYVVEHHWGEHPHAHAIAFADRRLYRADLTELRLALGEQERRHARALDQEHHRSEEPSAGLQEARERRVWGGPDLCW